MWRNMYQTSGGPNGKRSMEKMGEDGQRRETTKKVKRKEGLRLRGSAERAEVRFSCRLLLTKKKKKEKDYRRRGREESIRMSRSQQN